jgi:hypothetical protein
MLTRLTRFSAAEVATLSRTGGEIQRMFMLNPGP